MKLVITNAHDAIHREGTAGRGPIWQNGVLVADGHPGTTRCGQRAAVGVNDLAARQLYPSLSACSDCDAS